MSSGPQPPDTDPLKFVCAACRAGPFSYEGFRRAILKDFEDVDPDNVIDPTSQDEPRFKYIYTTTWGSITDSASAEKEGGRCNWCHLLIQNRDGLPDARFPRGGPDEEVTIRIEIRIQSPVDWMEVTNVLDLYINDYQTASYWIYAKPDNVAVEEIGKGDHFRLDPTYIDYEKAKKWLEECTSGKGNHGNCSKIGTTTLPTRVIDCSDPRKPRLVETQHRQGRFCTLSYVWGGDQHAKTTKANIALYMNEGITVPGLSQTIVDAITVTHNLGIRYLWVDALCIIQDSVEDKLVELANMAHIYQQAYVSLSVVSAFRADQGFLPDGREHVVLPFYMKDRDEEAADGSQHRLGSMLMKYYIRRQNPRMGYKYQTVQVFEPLAERGWCFQESMLSPRKLVFQPPTVRFDCRTYIKDLTRTSEGGRNNPPFQANVPPIFSTESDNPQSPGGSDEEENQQEDLYYHWGQLVFDYTARKITVPSDKFVAFSSITEVFQKALKVRSESDQYVAGLWLSRLIDGLLWDPFGDIGPNEVLRPRPKEYRAPTWSWASIDISVQAHRQHMFEAPSTDYEAQMISYSVQPKSSIHPFGEISDAKLEMRVKIHPLMLDGRKCRFTERKGTLSGDEIQSLYISGAWAAPEGNCLTPQTPDSLGRNEGEVRFDCAEGSEQDRDMDFYVVALRAGRKWGDQIDRPGWMMGLLVLKCDNMVETYKRVARIHLFHWPGWFDTVSLKTVTLV